jgi:hypothetical protein
VGVWAGNARSWAHPQRRAQAIRGGGGGQFRQGGAHGTERERASERASALTSEARRTERASARARREPAPTGQPHRAARGRERAS